MTLPEQPPAPLQTAAPLASEVSETRKGVAAALVAYLLWGFLPILFRLLDAVGSVLIVAERTVWSLLLVGAILASTGGFCRAWAVAALRASSFSGSSPIAAGSWAHRSVWTSKNVMSFA